jgi:hypothetical protein
MIAPRPWLGISTRDWFINSDTGRVLGVKVAACTVWAILQQAGIEPAPQRTATTWTTLLRWQARAIIAADLFETTTLTGTRPYVLAVIDHATRRVRILAAAAHPSTAWVTQAARNLVMDSNTPDARSGT